MRERLPLPTVSPRDWTGDAVGPVSEIPHETRRARKREDIVITGANGHTVTIDIVDTPGVTTKIDYHEFLEFGMEKDEAIIRAREATEGVAEAMHWLREDIDGVIYMLDSTVDPFMQVNIMMIGIIESRGPPGDHRGKQDRPSRCCAGKDPERLPAAPGCRHLGSRRPEHGRAVREDDPELLIIGQAAGDHATQVHKMRQGVQGRGLPRS